MKYVSLFLLLFSVSANAAFHSFEDLRSQLGEVGYPVVLQVYAGDLGPHIYLTGEQGHSLSIDDYINQNVHRKSRLPSFDFLDPRDESVTHEAYRVADVLVCYYELTGWRLRRRRLTERLNPGQSYRLEENFDYCVIVPAPIDEVEARLFQTAPTLIDPDGSVQ